MSEMPQEDTEVLKVIFTKAAEDPAFRALCLSNPREALAQAGGSPALSDREIIFVENGAEGGIPLPPSGSGDIELSEETLTAFSGGGARRAFRPERPANWD